MSTNGKYQKVLSCHQDERGQKDRPAWEVVQGPSEVRQSKEDFKIFKTWGRSGAGGKRENKNIKLRNLVKDKFELSHFSDVWLFATLWTLAHQAPPSMGFFRQEYWSGLSFPPPGDLPDPGIEPLPLMSFSISRQILYYSWPLAKPFKDNSGWFVRYRILQLFKGTKTKHYGKHVRPNRNIRQITSQWCHIVFVLSVFILTKFMFYITEISLFL